MPLISCMHCTNPMTLPDPWTAPGFMCPHCHRTTTFAAPAVAPLPSPAPTEVLSLSDEPDERPARPRRAPAAARDASSEAKGKALIFMGYTAFVVVPIVLVIAFAAYKFSGDDKKPDTAEVAPKVDLDRDSGKKPEPKRPTSRPKYPEKDRKDDEGVVPVIRTPDQETKPDPVKPDPIVKADPKPETTTKVDPKPDPIVKVDPKPDPVATLPPAPDPHSAPLAPAVFPIAIAPEPRAVRPLLAVPLGYASEWEKLGDVEVRVAGVAIKRVPITNADNREVDSPVAVLTIWIEVRTQVKTRTVELLRWQDSLGQYCQLTTRNNTLDRGPLGPGATLRTGLPYKQLVVPDGTPRVDVLVFSSPPEEAGELRLTLEGERVGEIEKIRLTIPASAWKK